MYDVWLQLLIDCKYTFLNLVADRIELGSGWLKRKAKKNVESNWPLQKLCTALRGRRELIVKISCPILLTVTSRIRSGLYTFEHACSCLGNLEGGGGEVSCRRIFFSYPFKPLRRINPCSISTVAPYIQCLYRLSSRTMSRDISGIVWFLA